MKSLISIILIASFSLLICLIIIWCLFFFFPLNIPEYIQFTPVKSYGCCLTILFITVFIIVLKRVLKSDFSISLLKLMLVGTIIGFFSEAFFQIFLSTTEESDKLYYFLHGTITMTISLAVLSFFIAFQLKTKKTGILIMLIIGLDLSLAVLNHFFPFSPAN